MSIRQYARVNSGETDGDWPFTHVEAKGLVVVFMALPFAAAGFFFSAESHTQSRLFLFPSWVAAALLVLAGRVLIGRAQKRRGSSFWQGGTRADFEAAAAALKDTGWNRSLVWSITIAGYLLSLVGFWSAIQAVMRP